MAAANLVSCGGLRALAICMKTEKRNAESELRFYPIELMYRCIKDFAQHRFSRSLMKCGFGANAITSNFFSYLRN